MISELRGGVVSPNGDGIDDTTKLSYVVSRPCQTEVGVTDAAGTLLRVLQAWTHVAPGAHGVSWNGKLPRGTLGAGRRWPYTFTVFVSDASGTAQAAATVKVNSTLGFPLAVPRYFSPGGDSRRVTSSLEFRLERPARMSLGVAGKTGAVLRSFSLGQLPRGPAGVVWNGRDSEGKPVPNGSYTFTVTAADSLGTIAVRARWLSMTSSQR